MIRREDADRQRRGGRRSRPPLIDHGALGPARGCRPSATSRGRSASAARPSVRVSARSRRSASCARAAAPAPTFPTGPPTLGAEALSFLAALHKFTVDDVYEARRILEVGAAGLAAERATPDQLATLADEVASLFASLNDRQVFLVHDINFHRGIAAASGNPIVASLVEMVSALFYEQRRTPPSGPSIAICATPPTRTARSIRRSAPGTPSVRARLMNEHLLRARSYQAKELLASTFKVQGAPKRRAAR